jgi:hypothetical protein
LSGENQRNPLWPLLVDAVHRLPLYPSHKAYARDNILVAYPNTSAEELARRLSMPLGEALVILYELESDKAYEGDGEG